jgi:uncharacterized membrane protein (DUF2068 family)
VDIWRRVVCGFGRVSGAGLRFRAILTASCGDDEFGIALANIQSLQSETSSAKSSIMNDAVHVPAILQEPRRVRYLKLIALFKIGKGVLLLLLGASLLFLNARDRWMGALSDWTDEEILLGHSKAVHFLLSKLQDGLAGDALRATGFLALFYCAVLFTEGIGVYFQKRWAELLMIFATAALIPLEVRHLWRLSLRL